MILLSGLLAEDKDIIVDAACSAGFVLKGIRDQMNWIALKFGKA